MARHLSPKRPRRYGRIATLSVVLALSFGIAAVAQTPQSDRDLLISIHQQLHAAGIPSTPTTSSTSTSTTATTAPTSTSTSTTQPPTTSTSTTQPPTTTSTIPSTGQPICTGAGLSAPGLLVVSTGNVTISTNGALVENREIRGRLIINASNVMVRNVWVWSQGTVSVIQSSSSGLTFDHVEVGKQGVTNSRGIASYGSGTTVRDSYIHDVEDGIKIGSNSTYTRNRINLLASPNSSPHSDTLQADGGQHDVVISNNCLDSQLRGGGFGNAALQLDTSLGALDDFLIEGNALNGGNYTVFWRAEPPNGAPTNGVLRNNWFGCQSRYGTVSSDGNLTRSGNRWAAGCPNAGQLIPGG